MKKMMHASQLKSDGYNPYLADEVTLGIDPIHLSVTLKGEQHQFDDKVEMERFLRVLWEQQVTD